MAEQKIAPQARFPMSIEKKLPLMMTTVLLLILAVGVTLAYREVANTAEDLAQQRVQEVGTQLASLIAAGPSRIARALAPVAADPAIQRLLREDHPSASTIDAAKLSLTKAIAPSDSGVGVAVADKRGLIITSVRTSDIGTAWAEGQVEDLSRPSLDSLSTSGLYLSNGRAFYSTVLPVREGGTRIGAIIEHRRLNTNPQTERDIAGLTGQDVGILLHNSDGSLWLTLGGKPVPAPSNPEIVQGMHTYVHDATRGGERVLIYEAPVKGMPWVVALELPVSTITATPRQILRQFLIVSLALLLAGAFAMWVIGRSITRPLATLTSAANAIAAGDYSQRVESTGDREIAQLASTFNEMAKGTSRAHRELEDRFREARSLAEELEHTNMRLRATSEAAHQAQIAAETANAAKSSFLAAMSHELRTPLNAIAGYVQLIQMGLRGPVTAEQQADLNRIKRSQSYLLGLIEDVLNFAKLDAHQMEFDASHIVVSEVMHDVETLLAPQIKAAGISYSCESCESPLAVCADEDKTRQILVNLISNAVKFTKPPGSIVVSCSASDETVQVRVTDTGIGIKPDDMERVFDPFVQIGRNLNQPTSGGVGLGLAISRDFARRMGGNLTVESTFGEGSTFTLVLPRSRSNLNDSRPSVQTDTGAAAV